MDVGEYKLLAKYNKEANAKMNEIILSLSDEDWNKEFGGYFKSIHELCSHIFVGDYRWLQKVKANRNFKNLPESFFNKEVNLSEVLFANIAEYIKARQELDNIIVDFANELTQNDLQFAFDFVNYKGITLHKKLEVYLLHLAHHETHHRGMISVYLDMLGKENEYSGLYLYG
jgi:uncharacterized damage-inducible protein DinB